MEVLSTPENGDGSGYSNAAKILIRTQEHRKQSGLCHLLG